MSSIKDDEALYKNFKNLSTQELCLYLDEERNAARCAHCGRPLTTRDDGDGSSSSAQGDDPSLAPPRPSVQQGYDYPNAQRECFF